MMKQILFTIDPKELRNIIREELQLILQQNNSPPTSFEEQFLDIKEASNYLKLSPHSLRKKCQKQEIPCYKVSSKWLFSKKELKDIIKQGKQLTFKELLKNG